MFDPNDPQERLDQYRANIQDPATKEAIDAIAEIIEDLYNRINELNEEKEKKGF